LYAAIKSGLRAIKVHHPVKINPQGQTGLRLRIYAERNLVERFFNAIKHYRGIATRYCIWSARSLGSNDDRP
jgi:transposase